MSLGMYGDPAALALGAHHENYINDLDDMAVWDRGFSMRDAPCNNCHICGSAGTLLHEGVTDRLFGVPGRWNFRQCNNVACGLVWLDPKPLESDLHEAYARYHTHGGDGSEMEAAKLSRIPARLKEAIRQIWLGALFLRSSRRAIDSMFLENMTPGRVLDVGCGAGHMMARLKNMGWHVEGQEVDPVAAEQARRMSGITVHVGNLAQLALPADSYDAIVMNHVIEHVHEPLMLLQQCRRLLKPAGVLAATTPNPRSFGHAKFQEAWRGLEVPRHLHLFPPAALARSAAAAGFTEWRAWTTAARAGGILAASLDAKRSRASDVRSWTKLLRLPSTAWYQVSARLAYVWDRDSGEEAILQARK